MAACSARSPHRELKAMAIESIPQQSNGALPTPAGDPPSSKPLPCPTLKFPTHSKCSDRCIDMMRSILDEQRRLNEWEPWWERDASSEEEEVEEYEMDDAERERMKPILERRMAEFQKAARHRLELFARMCQGSDGLKAPPLEMLDYPDLFERAWGWDRIVPRKYILPWSRYKQYLLDYYHRNLEEDSADGDTDGCGSGLADLAHKCIEMEGHLMFIWDKNSDLPTDGDKIRQVSSMIIEVAHEVKNAQKVEYPCAAVALKCITAEASLMCDWIMMNDFELDLLINVSNEARLCALAFMIYKGPEQIVAKAAMMGMMKEAKMISQRFMDRNNRVEGSIYIREHALVIMFDICNDCCAVKGSTGGSTTGECTFNKIDGKNFPEKNSVKKNNLEERNSISQNIKIGPQTEDAKEDDTMERTNAGDFVSDGSADRSSSEKKLFEKDNEEERDKIHEDTEVKEASLVDTYDGSADMNSSKRKLFEKDEEERDKIHENTEDLVKEDNPVAMGEINQNIKIDSEVKEGKKDNAMGVSKFGEFKFDGSADWNCSEEKPVKKDNEEGTTRRGQMISIKLLRTSLRRI